MDMTLPLYLAADWSAENDMAIAFAIGIGFGFLLERAGFGGARKLTAVFYFYDMAVLKVMFTAIVTTLAGLFLLSAAGWLDLSELWVTPTNAVAQIAGGLLFGVGFVVGGYCPGTSVAGIATGRLDALVFALGLVTGLIAYAELLPGLDVWIRDNSQGDLTLPGVTGIGMGWWVLAFLAIWALTAWGISVLERRFACLNPAVR
ncbi:MAG: DUF6691 family protein [Pseudomonadota bacterium]